MATARALVEETTRLFTWLGALSNLDLKLLCICQELGSHAKAATGNLHGMRDWLHILSLSRRSKADRRLLLSMTGKSAQGLVCTAMACSVRVKDLSGADLLDAGRSDISCLEALQVREGGRVALRVHVPEVLPALRVLSTLTAVALACMPQHLLRSAERLPMCHSMAERGMDCEPLCNHGSLGLKQMNWTLWTRPRSAGNTGHCMLGMRLMGCGCWQLRICAVRALQAAHLQCGSWRWRWSRASRG